MNDFVTQLDFLRSGAVPEFVLEFRRQMKAGLDGRAESLAMFHAFLPKPSKFKSGPSVGVDLSGTNLRVILARVRETGVEGEPVVKIFRIPEELKSVRRDAAASSAKLWDFVAAKISESVTEWNLPATGWNIGLTFAFPTKMHARDRGELIKWTKRWDLPDLVGKDPAQALCQALERRQMKCRVTALVNDTVGTLCVGYFRDRRATLGGILGTGSNFAGWIGNEAVNFESGNFNLGPLKDKLQTMWDKRLDAASENPGEQLLEKMIAGKYLGELLRLWLEDAAAEGGLFEDADLALHFIKEAGKVPGCVEGADVSTIVSDTPAENYMRSRHFFARLGIERVNDAACVSLLAAAQAIERRSAHLAAAEAAASLEEIAPQLPGQYLIAIDGSLYEHTPGYPQAMVELFQSVWPQTASRVQTQLVKDGSGLGAALAAAIPN